MVLRPFSEIRVGRRLGSLLVEQYSFRVGVAFADRQVGLVGGRVGLVHGPCRLDHTEAASEKSNDSGE